LTANPLQTLLTTVETPDEALNQRFLRARDLVRNSSPDALPDDHRIPALLAIGDHGAALDRLRALRPLSGPQFELLLHYAIWTGDQRWLAALGAEGLRGISGTPPQPGRGTATALQRGRDSTATLTPAESAELVMRAIVELWGVVPNGAGQSVAIEPSLPAEWGWMNLRNLRIGETLLDFVLRRTRNGLSLTVRRTRGPAIRLVLTMAGIQEFDVDGEALTGGRAIFRVENEVGITMQR
jgi:hypothetical protein